MAQAFKAPKINHITFYQEIDQGWLNGSMPDYQSVGGWFEFLCNSRQKEL